MKMSKIAAASLAVTLVGSSANCLQEYSSDSVIVASAATTTAAKATTTTAKPAATTTTAANATTTTAKPAATTTTAANAATTTSKPAATTTTTAAKAATSTTTSASADTTATTTSLTNEQLMKNADVDGSGEINAVDSSIIGKYYRTGGWDSAIRIREMMGNTAQMPEGAGDVNGDGKVNIIDQMAVLDYYAMFTIEYDVNEYFINLSKAPRSMEKTVTISQAAASGNENDEYCEFVLKMDSELPIVAFEGKLLFNGKSPHDAGVREMEVESRGYNCFEEDGYFQIMSGLHSSRENHGIIFRVYGIKAGEYAITYDDIKCYSTEGTEYSGYTKKDFEPYLTVTAAEEKALGDVDGNGIIDAVDASKIMANYAKYSTGTATPTEEDVAVCDVNRDGHIDAVDASKVSAYYAHVSIGGKLTIEEFLKK